MVLLTGKTGWSTGAAVWGTAGSTTARVVGARSDDTLSPWRTDPPAPPDAQVTDPPLTAVVSSGAERSPGSTAGGVSVPQEEEGEEEEEEEGEEGGGGGERLTGRRGGRTKGTLWSSSSC